MSIDVEVMYLDNYPYEEVKPMKYAHPGDAGFDLVAAVEEDVTIFPHKFVGVLTPVETIRCGVSFQIPEGYHIEVRSRSGLARKHGVFVVNSPGTVDPGYRGEVCAVLANVGTEPYIVKRGDRIAQAVLIKHETANLIEVKELSSSNRGEGGFGSTGR